MTDAPNPHAPAPTFAARLLGRYHVTGVFWYQFPYYAFTTLPTWTEVISVPLFTVFFLITLGRIRNAIASNLDPVLGPTNFLGRWRRAFRTMYTFAWVMPERYRFFKEPERFHTTVEGEEHWREVMAPGTGVILVGAHIGCWERSAQIGASVEKRRIHVIREKEINPRAQEFMRKLIERSGEQCVTHYAGEDSTLALELSDALRDGDIVAIQADRPRAVGRTVTAMMFGRPIPLPVGPAILARATGAPIVPVFNFREGRYRSHIVVRPPIRVERTRDREADVAQAIHRVAKEIEDAIRHEPHQWFCFRQLW